MMVNFYTASTSSLEISTITNTSNSEQQNSHGLSSMLKTAVVNNTTCTKKGYPNTMDLIELFAYVKLNYLSNESGDNLLQLLRDFVDRHPTYDDVFLHSNYRSIYECIGKAISCLYELVEVNVTYPICLLGTNTNERRKVSTILQNRGGGFLNNIRPTGTDQQPHGAAASNNSSITYAKRNGLNIVQIVAQYLIELDIDSFHFQPIEHLNPMNRDERCYSSFATADLFSHIYHEVQVVYGMDTVPICLQLSFDATDISK